jgi:hypothetical protein
MRVKSKKYNRRVSMGDNAWVAGLKKGDKVILYGWRCTVVRTVDRTTKTLVIIGGKKFYRSDGGEYGRTTMPVWDNRTYLKQYTEEEGNVLAEAEAHRRAVSWLSSVNWKKLDLPTLTKIKQLVTEADTVAK